MKYLISISLVIVCLCGCRKTKKVEPATQQPASTDTTTPTPPAFSPWTDTFKGSGMNASDRSMISDSMVFFFVHHFVRDSLEITSNVTFQYDENNNEGDHLKQRFRYNKSGMYPPGSTFPDIVFKQDSILYKWSYRYELKIPSGGVHYDTYRAYGRRIN